MTWRKIISYGLIAGLRVEEMGPLPPGMILDLFIYRRDYDDAEHGITREAPKIYD